MWCGHIGGYITSGKEGEDLENSHALFSTFTVPTMV